MGDTESVIIAFRKAVPQKSVGLSIVQCRVKRGIMSTLTLLTNFGQINAVKNFKLDLIECLYIYAVIYNIKQHHC